MPVARPPLPPKEVAPVTSAEADYSRSCVQKYYGDDAVVRNFGPDPQRLELHVETAIKPGMEAHECLGLILCEVNRDHVSLEVTGLPPRGDPVSMLVHGGF